MKIQERVITTKTADGKTILTKITTLPGEETEEIEEETTETIDGESKTNKTKSQVVKAPIPVSKLPNGKEIPLKADMKEGETTSQYDEETKTTVVTKRLANGYEQTFTTVTPEGNNKTWTKTWFDPVAVEGDEEEEEIEEYEEIETSGGNKTVTTTTQQQDPKAAAPKATPAKPAAVPAKPAAAPSAKPSTTTTTTTTSTAPTAVKPKVTPSEKTVVKKVPNGKQEITTTIDAEGRETTKIHTMTDLPDQAEEYEEYEETHITEDQPKTRKTTTTTSQPTAVPKKQTQVVPAGKTPINTTVAVPGKNPKDNVLARKVVNTGEEELQITEEHTETEFSPSRKTTVNTSVVPSTGEKLDAKGKTTVSKVVIPGSQSTVVTKSNEQDGKQIVVKKGPSGTQNIAKTTNPDGSKKVSVTTTVNPEEVHIEETETTNIIGDKTITTTRTEVPIPGKKKIVTQLPAQKVAGKGPKTTTTTTTTTLPVGEDRKTTTTKRVDKGTEVAVKTETKDGKTRLETRTKFDPIFHPAVSDEEEVEEYEEETQTFAPVKTKTTTTTRVPVEESKKKPVAASSKAPAAAAAAVAPKK